MYYVNYPGYYPNSTSWPDREQYPPVDANLLYQSANETKKLMDDASIVLNKLAESHEFDAELMYAAQVADTAKVERLIHSTGIKSEVDIHYNPDGLRLILISQVANTDCCKLQIALRWR
ncbi:hypothetical protein [Virgibacillus sp. JSM 102003]|uniref:hypothetical protein n=1 Tax=Virgibacillus sp. JSM 102003 TaxID=1562108 RepID=UPI0035C0DD3D